MPHGPPIPDDLLRFLEVNVDSIEQLELLRIVGESPGRLWKPEELASEAQALPGSLRILEQRGLLKEQAAGSELRYGAGTLAPERASTLARLLQLYKERPVTLIRFVYSHERKSLTAFAESFRIRKEP